MDENGSSEASRADSGAERLKETGEKAESFDPSNLIGETLEGRYELEKCIGRGGMGVVYLASQSALDRKVVVKVLPPSFVDDEEASARFEREAVGMSKLQHPHIVSIYDFGYYEDQAYIVMEYVEGVTLQRRIKTGPPMDFASFGAIAAQILEGIGEAHSMGLLHRDIKPANIMLTERREEQNYVKILDFGLAKLAKGAREVTKEQQLIGSVSYLSPEQILGNETDQRVDVYALGVLFYYMLTGNKPFVGEDDVAVLYQHVHQEPERLEQVLPRHHDIPQSAIELIHQALAKDPANRPVDAAHFLAALRPCFEEADISSPHVSGQFNVVSRVADLKQLSPDDPSKELDRQRRYTPIHQGPAEATPSGARDPLTEAESTSESVDELSGEELDALHNPDRLRNLLLAVVGVLLVGGAGVFWYLSSQPEGPSQEQVQAELARAAQLIDDGELERAESALDSIEPDLDRHDGLSSDFGEVRDKLAIAELLVDAELYEEVGDVEAAMSTYQEVLSREPGHERARQRLEGLRAAGQAKDVGDEDVDKEQPGDDRVGEGSAGQEQVGSNPPTGSGGDQRAGAGQPAQRGDSEGSKSPGASKPRADSASQDKGARGDGAARAPEESAPQEPRADKAPADGDAEDEGEDEGEDDGLLLPDDDDDDSDSASREGDLLPAEQGEWDGDLILD
jgi:eukaryotic-like serine/threonine-protein kinase